MRFCKTFWENRQVLQALSKKLLPLSLTIPCFEAQCGLKKTICLFHSFPVCSCILYRLLLIHMPSQQTHKIHCAIPLHLVFVPLPLSCIHPSIYMYMGHGCGHVYIFFHKISLGFSQDKQDQSTTFQTKKAKRCKKQTIPFFIHLRKHKSKQVGETSAPSENY